MKLRWLIRDDLDAIFHKDSRILQFWDGERWQDVPEVIDVDQDERDSRISVADL